MLKTAINLLLIFICCTSLLALDLEIGLKNSNFLARTSWYYKPMILRGIENAEKKEIQGQPENSEFAVLLSAFFGPFNISLLGINQKDKEVVNFQSRIKNNFSYAEVTYFENNSSADLSIGYELFNNFIAQIGYRLGNAAILHIYSKYKKDAFQFSNDNTLVYNLSGPSSGFSWTFLFARWFTEISCCGTYETGSLQFDSNTEFGEIQDEQNYFEVEDWEAAIHNIFLRIEPAFGYQVNEQTRIFLEFPIKLVNYSLESIKKERNYALWIDPDTGDPVYNNQGWNYSYGFSLGISTRFPLFSRYGTKNEVRDTSIFHPSKKGMEVSIENKALFDPQQTVIKPEARSFLNTLTKVILEKKGEDLLLETSAAPERKTLAEKRLNAVSLYFQEKGVQKERIRTSILNSIENRDWAKEEKIRFILIRIKEESSIESRINGLPQPEQETVRSLYYNGLDSYYREAYDQAVEEWQKIKTGDTELRSMINEKIKEVQARKK